MNQAESKTAIAATMAAELRGIRGADQAEWFQEQLRIEVGERGRKDSLKRRKARSPWDEKRGRKPAAEEAAEPAPASRDAWLWDTVEIDPFKLDLQQAIVLFPEVKDPEAVLSNLRSTIGVLRIYETYGGIGGALIVVHVVYMGAQRRGQLDARLRELQAPFEWLEVRSVAPTRAFEGRPAAATWEALAQQFSELEDLQAEPVSS
jgi:hypothetical protein